ncbi:hypothetical protein KC315_g10651 [Hortaea werneckii]|nr:hypothetical protein KC315_g10651 [Hortaea werneckii]
MNKNDRIVRLYGAANGRDEMGEYYPAAKSALPMNVNNLKGFETALGMPEEAMARFQPDMFRQLQLRRDGAETIPRRNVQLNMNKPSDWDNIEKVQGAILPDRCIDYDPTGPYDQHYDVAEDAAEGEEGEGEGEEGKE